VFSRLCVVVACVSLLACGKPTQEQIDRENLATVTRVCKDAIKARARDPESVVFESDSAKALASSYTVSVTYRAKNGFGGYVRESVACVVGADGTVHAVLRDR
jgi:hypothetical protein